MLSSPLYAQTTQRLISQTQFGIKGGLIASSIAGDVSTSFYRRYVAGGWFMAPFVEKTQLKVEILYTGQGAWDRSRKRENGRWDYLYLNVPILIMFSPFDEPDLMLEAGLQAGNLLDARYIDDQRRYNIKSETRDLDLSLVGGVAWNFLPRWMTDVRVTMGLMDHSLRTWTNDEYYNFTLQWGISYLIPAR